MHITHAIPSHAGVCFHLNWHTFLVPTQVLGKPVYFCCSYACASLVYRYIYACSHLPKSGSIKLSSALVWRERQKLLIYSCVCARAYVKLLKHSQQSTCLFLLGIGTSCSLTFWEVFKVHVLLEDDVRFYCHVWKLQSSMQIACRLAGGDIWL